MSLCHRFSFRVNGRFSSAYRFSCFQVEFIGVVHQPEDSVGQCLVLHGIMPGLDGQLAGHDGGFPVVALLDDFRQLFLVIPRQWRDEEIVQYQNLAFGRSMGPGIDELIKLSRYQCLAVRSNSCISSGLKSRPGSCPFAPVAQGSGVLVTGGRKFPIGKAAGRNESEPRCSLVT